MIYQKNNWGHAIAYQPELAKHLKSINGAILFGFFMQFDEFQKDELGISKNSQEIEESTALTYREQVTARKALVDSGFLKETNKRLEHKIYYKINESLK